LVALVWYVIFYSENHAQADLR